MSAPTIEYVEKFVSADGLVHDFLEKSIEDRTITAFVPRCQLDRNYPSLRFFRSELREETPAEAVKCHWCEWRERVHL